MNTLRWLRVIGDTVFTAGALGFVVAVARMTLTRRRAHSEATAAATHLA